ncbi:MAG: DnaJ domain-containing protein [Pseudomonadota bacterium]
MSLYLKIILTILGLAYLISPMDIIPEIFIPYIGWIDDGLVLACIFYMLRNNKLPDFTFLKNKNHIKNSSHNTSEHNRFQGSAYGANGANDTGGTSHKKKDNTDQSSETKNHQTDNHRQKTPYDVLGIDPDASKLEIQTAYKKAIKKYHPDKLSHLGEEFTHLANKKFIEIQRAYDFLIHNKK